ncbi:glycerol-3-phosphate dehydrogenase/oxidase [Granulicella sp. S190]|uniref:glycerol-3-phosphate dehydrogenase/oxidase n=1 Tax=Granulicella sp. S190 TaxID=1747226 RepID=UPI00131AF27D|nr:FAD-dependent oxidoreductase [Granulicella sp. S190]
MIFKGVTLLSHNQYVYLLVSSHTRRCPFLSSSQPWTSVRVRCSNLNKVVVNATGPVSDTLRQMATPSVPKRMRHSKGAHILLPLEVFPTKDALLIPKTEDGRVLSAVPWGGRLLVGTTDEEIDADAELVVTDKDIEYLLRHINHYLTRPVTPADVVSGFAGARPLIASGDQDSTKELARDDEIEIDDESHLISIMGGKWTTHRAMAEDSINAVQEAAGIARTESLTRNHVLYGGEGFTDNYWKRLVRQFHISDETAHHLSCKFGIAAESILRLTADNAELAEPMVAGYPAIKAEVIYAVRQEMAVTIEDVLARRIGLQMYSWRDAIDAAPVVGWLMA